MMAVRGSHSDSNTLYAVAVTDSPSEVPHGWRETEAERLRHTSWADAGMAEWAGAARFETVEQGTRSQRWISTRPYW